MEDLIKSIQISDVAKAEDILKAAGTEDLFEKAKHQDGDMHPNGKWVWVSSANGGKGDWRTKGGRTHTKHSVGGNAEVKTDTTPTQKKPTTKTTGTTSKSNDIIEVGKIYFGKFDGDTIEYEVKEKRDGDGYQLISYTYSKDEDEFGNPKKYIDIQEETKTLDDMVDKIKKEKYFLI